jgi:phosphate:Na+ symporter
MNTWSLASGLAGGVGLFLLGMHLMSEGLKLAAGRQLEQMLARATRSRLRALGAGVLVTALVQSSSAVTVATIGFVNAGLLTLSQALWVLFGSNVGTTMTGWLVAMVGLKVKIDALALPLVGVGTVLHLSGMGHRRGALGQALAGFGLLFIGIDVLQRTFTDLAATLSLPEASGLTGLLSQLGAGIALTVLMQSSSAALTVALSAAAGGLLTAQGAAAVVIGANIGTTVTAVLAALGATASARRAAAAHVAFNLLTGIVALVLLPWLIDALGVLRAALGLPADPAARLALFHTIFNVLGVLLMWPLAGALTRALERRFRTREDDEAQPRYLDDNVLAVPTLAVDALVRELERLRAMAIAVLREALDGSAAQPLARRVEVLDRLHHAIAAFVVRLHRVAMNAESAERLPTLLRIARYSENAAQHARQAAPWSAAEAGELRAAAIALLERVEGGYGDPAVAEALARVESAYETHKVGLLRATADARIDIAEADERLQKASDLRRALQQIAKAARGLGPPRGGMQHHLA